VIIGVKCTCDMFAYCETALDQCKTWCTR